MAKVAKKWRLIGFDTFASEAYDLPGRFDSEVEARDAARAQLAEIEKTQPSESSGGQEGIQDRILIERPDGTRYQFRE